ncbi:unnamed protein product [Pieris brassicae]|uniref:Uncharacterized protein n=1 Tax=Pieris brassicae TaxID=7116 RepID=A0A9P0TM61_PIEBR|nr:unnamed protein product [Pieris brassicae]
MSTGAGEQDTVRMRERQFALEKYVLTDGENSRIPVICTKPTVGTDTEIEPLALQRFAEFNCFKLKTCTRGGVAVCGFDDTRRVLAQFEDMCTLYQVNCEGKGGNYRNIISSGNISWQT